MVPGALGGRNRTVDEQAPIARLRHHPGPSRRPKDGMADIGILVAGLVGFLAARPAVAPLEKALALRTRFVADAGHELRAPLAVLHTRAQLLARRLPPADRRGCWRILLANSRVLGEIVDEMPVSAQLATDPGAGELIDPADLATDIVTSMNVLGADAGVTLRAVAQSSRTVRGSEAALRRALDRTGGQR